MTVQLNSFNIANINLPLTITPIIPALKDLTVSAASKSDMNSVQPDLTFHCMCCPAYFVNPYMLYQHMNSQHPQPLESDEGGKTASDDDDQDYSWVLEPVCEIVDMEGDDGDDDSDSDSDSDEDSSTSSSQTSSSSSTTVSASNSNSVTRDTSLNDSQGHDDDYTRMTSVSTNTVPPAIYEEIVGNESTNSFCTTSESAYPMIKLRTADPRESTSIILLKPLLENISEECSNSMTVIPFIPKPGRGRRSAAQNAQLAALTNGDKKCFQCAHCEVSFQNAGDLSKHVRCHITNKPFQCGICEKTFTHIGSLNTHIRIHSGEKPYKCELCPKAFTQSSSLMVHVRSHSIRKPHQCYLCDKGFINSSSLVLHLKSHDDTEIFNCPECDKSFKQEDLLEKHLQMHTQQLVYQCSICHTAFRTSSELVQHMKCHMGEKPFTCSICDRSFTQSGSLGIHMRIHTGERPFQCKLCDKAFTQASSLSVHMKIHSGEKSYPCHICGKSYSQQAYLNKHIQAHLTAGENTIAMNVANAVQLSDGIVPSEETLVCIVCGVLHKDVSSLALHVTQKHAVLLKDTGHSNTKQMQMSSDYLGEEERRLQEQQYIQQLQLIMRTGGVLPQIAMDVDTRKNDGELVRPGNFERIGDNENNGNGNLETVKQDFDQNSFDDYGAEEEVETEE